VVEPVDDWTDCTYVLCNNAHSHFISENQDVVGKRIKQLKHIDLDAASAFLAVCKGNSEQKMNLDNHIQKN
jgi:hypothetical protein